MSPDVAITIRGAMEKTEVDRICLPEPDVLCIMGKVGQTTSSQDGDMKHMSAAGLTPLF